VGTQPPQEPEGAGSQCCGHELPLGIGVGHRESPSPALSCLLSAYPPLPPKVRGSSMCFADSLFLPGLLCSRASSAPGLRCPLFLARLSHSAVSLCFKKEEGKRETPRLARWAAEGLRPQPGSKPKCPGWFPPGHRCSWGWQKREPS
jgi:hypothetical protein